METLLSLCVGVGLSAACGFRVFVPLLLMSIAANSGHLALATGFEWIGSFPALLAFAVASVVEIAGFFVPWIDHLLDVAATPAAIVAGIVVTASIISDVSPFLRWSLAVIAGGGAAGIVQASTVTLRGASLVSTGGFGNPLISAAELVGSVLASVMAIVVPVLAIVTMIAAVLLMMVTTLRFREKSTRIAAEH